MRSTSKLLAAALMVTGLFAGGASAADLPRLKVQDGKIVDPAGHPATLRGVNLGNWLLIEPGTLGGAWGKFGDQAGLFHILRDRFGEAERRRLIDLYRDHYITARDFDNAKSFGFNFLRVGFDHELLEDEARPWVLRPDAFKYLDYAVKEAKARGMYVLFDLHGAQGRQVSGKQGGDASRADFWTVPDNQERALWMWAKIAERYKNEPAVVGYEVLNEPFSGTDAALLDFSKRWYDRMRPLAPDQILMFPAMYKGIGFYGKPAGHGWTNVMFDRHYYPGVAFSGPAATQPSTVQSASRTLRTALPKVAKEHEALGAPLMIGELSIVYKSGGGGEMVRRYTDFAAAHNWIVSIWTLKELSPKGGVSDKMWMLTTNANPIPPVDIHTSTKGEIEQAILDLSTMPLAVDEDVRHWQTTTDKPAPLPPMKDPTAATAPAIEATGEPTTQPATP